MPELQHQTLTTSVMDIFTPANPTSPAWSGVTAIGRPIYGNGNGTFAVGDMYSNTGSAMNPGGLADGGFGGWSLVTIYSSPETKGHQLYLYDKMTAVPSGTSSDPTVISEQISGFFVPDQITGETDSDNVTKLTVFVGEGDVSYGSDYVAFIPPDSSTEHTLWDSVNISPSGQRLE